MQKPIFISYSSQDKEIATALCAHLEQSNLNCWMAPRDIAPGKSYAAAIVDAINQSKIMVLVFSEHANNSDHVLNEVERAFNKKITIIPFRITDTIPSSSMEYFLSLKHWLDAFDKKPSHYFDAVQKVCNQLLERSNAMKSTSAHQTASISAKKNKPLFYGLGILAVLLVGYFIWSTNKPVSKASQSNKDTVAASLPETVTEKATELQTKTSAKNPETTATPPKTPTVFAPENASTDSANLNNVTFTDAASDDKLYFTRNAANGYGFLGRINGNPVSGAVKYQGNQQYKITQSASVKGSFYIDETQLNADVTLLKNGIDFNPGTITLARE